jgi:nitrogen fixation protein NifB
MGAKDNISVAGIAGPGDPMANPEQTIETLSLIREKYPDLLLCLATNGLNLEPYADRLADIGVSHVTVTVNAVDPAVGEKLYSWVRFGRRVHGPASGARILMERQQAAIRSLAAKPGITLKVNFIVIPGINDFHAEETAQKMAGYGVDLFNCMAYRPAPGSALAHLHEPDAAAVGKIRKAAEKHLPQMRHCTRCRADAVGLLGQGPDAALMETMKSCAAMDEDGSQTPSGSRPHVAVASMEGLLVNQHLGEAGRLLIYRQEGGAVSLKESRNTPPRGSGELRWEQMAGVLSDCQTLLVSGIGDRPKVVLEKSGLDVKVIDGLIDDAVAGVFAGKSLRHMTRREIPECTGTGMGCG